MRTHTIGKPTGTDAATDFALRQQNRAQEELQFFDSTTVKFSRTTRGITARVIPARGGPSAAGIHRPGNGLYEVDPTYPYDRDSLIHIQPSHALVGTGIRLPSAPTGALVQACAGWWIANQDVPAQATVSGNLVWNVPQWPLPVPTNVDDLANFWSPYLGEVV